MSEVFTLFPMHCQCVYIIVFLIFFWGYYIVIACLWLWNRDAQKVSFPRFKVAYAHLSHHRALFLWLDHFRVLWYQAGLCMGRYKGSSDSTICGVVNLCCVRPVMSTLLTSQSGNRQTKWTMERAQLRKCDIARGGRTSLRVRRLNL